MTLLYDRASGREGLINTCQFTDSLHYVWSLSSTCCTTGTCLRSPSLAAPPCRCMHWSGGLSQSYLRMGIQQFRVALSTRHEVICNLPVTTGHNHQEAVHLGAILTSSWPKTRFILRLYPPMAYTRRTLCLRLLRGRERRIPRFLGTF